MTVLLEFKDGYIKYIVVGQKGWHIMKRLHFHSMIIALTLAFSVNTFAQDTILPVLKSPDQAVAPVTKFLKSVGWSYNPNSLPKAELASGVHGGPYTYQVRIGDILTEIDGITGRIRYAGRPSKRKDDDTVLIDSYTASAQSKKYLGAAGISLANAKLCSSRAISYSDESGYTKWELTYFRIYNGFLFDKDFIRVNLDICDGSLLSFGCNFDSPLPKMINAKVTQIQAVSYGKKYMHRLGLDLGGLVEANLRIVQPDYSWEYWDISATPPEPTESRLAWVLQFDSPGNGIILWVDAENGDVLGGAMALGVSLGKIFRPALSEITRAELQCAGCKGTREIIEQIPLKQFIDTCRRLKTIKSDTDVYPITMTLFSENSTYVFGFSAIDHRLKLLHKQFGDRSVQCNMAWETNKEFEDLISAYVEK